VGEIEFDQFVHEAVVPHPVERLLGIEEKHCRMPSPVEIIGYEFRDSEKLVFGAMFITETVLEIGQNGVCGYVVV